MQFQPQPTAGNPPQLSLFEGLIAHQVATPFGSGTKSHVPALDDRGLSELSLSGTAEHCRLLLAPILRDLSEAADTRWLTLIAPPPSMSLSWLRESDLNRDRILLLQAPNVHGALDLACKALVSGCSHTVITWFDRLDRAARMKLRAAADQGGAQSLNIRLSK